ncbi:MAG: tetratricopeptide repeat protein [Spirochaetaceae bacterium]|mgnify:FL=1|nr:tetratricopeptide repeat protein [Spirochaetaceae bacterium]
MSSQPENEIKRVYDLLKQGDYQSAKEVLSEILVDDLENPEILFGLKCTGFWENKLTQISEITNLFPKGEQLISGWKEFLYLIDNEKSRYEQCIYSIKKGVFTQVLEIFQRLLQENTFSKKGAIVGRIGLCYKQLGDYDTALRFLGEANLENPEKASILAEMADCYALCGEEKTSKILFREAFFINPQDVDISVLESELFCRLYSEVIRTGKKDEVAAEWFPVEGVLLGVLNVKRELRALEVGKLKQNIYALETELKDEGVDSDLIIPRLINNYFRLIDHYTTVMEDRTKINEILLKIKLLNADVYERYTV